MGTKWRNRLLYWALALVPLLCAWLVAKMTASYFFVFFLFFYWLTYRPLLDTQRLMSLRKIEEKDAWRFFVPFAVDQTKYIKALWLG